MSLERLEKIFGRISMLIVDTILSYFYIIHAGKYWITDIPSGTQFIYVMLVVPVVVLWMLTLCFFIPEDD